MHPRLVADTIAFSDVDGPGNRFVVFLQGCNFDCVACHNPQTIPGNAAVVEGHHPHHVSVDELLVQIRRAAPFIRGITVSGGEATQQAAVRAHVVRGDQGQPRAAPPDVLRRLERRVRHRRCGTTSSTSSTG